MIAPAVDQFCRQHLLHVMPPRSQLIEVIQSRDVPRGPANVLVNTIAALNQADFQRCFVCEYDWLYPPEYFARPLEHGAANYTQSVYCLGGGIYIRKVSTSLATLAGDRDRLRQALIARLQTLPDAGEYRIEPDATSSFPRAYQRLHVPALDVRHGRNWSGSVSRWTPPNHQMTTLPYWGEATSLWDAIWRDLQWRPVLSADP